MFYELATLTVALRTWEKGAAAVQQYAMEPEARGRLLGCFHSDIGTLNQLIVLRGFDDERDMAAERKRALLSSNPFNSGEFLTALSMDAYAPLPDLPPVEPGDFGPVYEIRTYGLRIGSLPALMDAWRTALPQRTAMSKLLVAMYALDGPPRFTHIWPYPSLNDRQAIRADAVARGIWPPKLVHPGPTPLMQSTICFPTAASPLR
jgi:hypothetical protein